MPIYEYECKKCHRIEEVLQKFSDKPHTKCRHCSGKLQKLVSHSSFHLKGTGWYVTDYAGKTHAPASGTDKPKETATADTRGSKSDTKKTKESSD